MSPGLMVLHLIVTFVCCGDDGGVEMVLECDDGVVVIRVLW